MNEVNTEALQAEFDGMVSGESAETPETQTPEQVEMMEAIAGDQRIKLPLTAEFPVKHNRQIVNAPLEKLMTAWRERSHYDDKFKSLKEERAAFDQERGDFNQFGELKKKYGDIQSWSEANPQEWNSLWEMFQNRDQHLSQGGEQQDYFAKEIAAMREEMNGLKETNSRYEQMVQSNEEKADVEEVNKEIEAFKKEFADVDLGEKDLDGIPLQDNIISFGIKHGMPSFESAALTFLKSRLVQTAEMRGRKDTVEKVKKDHNEGVVGRSNTPFSGKEVDPRKMGSEELRDSALAEFEKLIGQQK